MTISIQSLYRGVEKYLLTELAPKSSGLTKFMVYFITPSIPNKIDDIIKHYHSFFEPYFDSDGNILLDDLYQAANNAMSHSISIEFSGFIFKESDVTLLYNLIKECA